MESYKSFTLFRVVIATKLILRSKVSCMNVARMRK